MMNSCLPLAGNLLLRNVRNEFSNNVVVSPLSLNAVAAMGAAGCSGRSLDRLLSFLGCSTLDELKSMVSKMTEIANSDEEGSPKISFVNGVWVDKRFPLKPSYQNCLSESSNQRPKT